VAELARRAGQDLWPELPERVPDMVAWRADVRAVADQVPVFERLLEDVRGRGRRQSEGWRFASPRDEYLHDHIVDLLAAIGEFEVEGGPQERFRIGDPQKDDILGGSGKHGVIIDFTGINHLYGIFMIIVGSLFLWTTFRKRKKNRDNNEDSQ